MIDMNDAQISSTGKRQTAAPLQDQLKQSDRIEPTTDRKTKFERRSRGHARGECIESLRDAARELIVVARLQSASA